MVSTKTETADTAIPEQDTTSVDAAPVDSEPASSKPAESAVAEAKSARRSRSVSLSVRSLVVGGALVLLTVAVAVVGWLYIDTRSQLDAEATQLANNSRAEKMALDYAVNAATMDYKDLQAWKVRLVEGTTPELNTRLSEAGTSMEQVLVPLEWSSSARPLAAKVRSNNGGVYVVDSFVSVQTKTIQSPESLQSTATYSTTIDSHNNWQITDVGGIGSALEPS
jgi:Mce-associated membrane protein